MVYAQNLPVPGRVLCRRSPQFSTIGLAVILRAVWFVHLTLLLSCSGESALSNLPPPPSSSNPWTNLPAGHRVLSNNPWDVVEGGGWGYYRPHPYGFVRIAQDASDPASPSNVLERVYTTDMPDGYQPGSNSYALGGRREAYVGFYWKTSENWQRHSLGMKVAMFLIQGGGNMFLNWTTRDNGLMLSPQGWNGGVSFQANVNRAASAGPAPGVWQKVEIYVRYNDAGQQNGVIRWWIDGVLAGDHTNVVFPSGGLADFHFAGTWGGGGSSPVHQQSIFKSHTIISAP
jgi:hypothetical protein